jgi:hypothetical protein
MATDDQSATIDFLTSPSTHGGGAVERIDTHASIVFLTSSRALKLKRAVRYDYLDFSTVERRRRMCEAEVRINRRTAPALYRSVIAVTREPDGSLHLGGTGVPVDWLVEMARFDQDMLFDRLAARDALDVQLMAPLAVEIARFHREAELRRDHGGASGLAWVIDGNVEGFREQGAGALDARACAELTREARLALDRNTELLEARRQAGFVRQCHGDLHLRNIVLLEGRPTLFDGVEFNDQIACIDVMYDLAFLLMDLWRRELPRHANAVLNGYLVETGDFESLQLLPLFLSCRAAVRAKTSATAARLQAQESSRTELQSLARSYLALAGRLLRPASPSLIAVGGLSGSGKSALAMALAPSLGPVPGAVVIRSDEIRKQQCGVGPFDRLGPEGYTPEISKQVYATVADRSRIVIDAGHSAIADAVFARPSDREAIELVALRSGIPFTGLWLDAPETVLIDRVSRRTQDASDADARIVRSQVRQDVGAISWHRIDGSSSTADALSRVLGILDPHVSRHR